MIIPNNHYLVTTRHEGYDIALKCPDCGYHCEHLEIGTDDVWPEELRALMDIDSGRVEIVRYSSAEEFIKAMDKELEND